MNTKYKIFSFAFNIVGCHFFFFEKLKKKVKVRLDITNLVRNKKAFYNICILTRACSSFLKSKMVNENV